MSKDHLTKRVERLEKKAPKPETDPEKARLQQPIRVLGMLNAATLNAFISALSFVKGEPPSKSYPEWTLKEPLNETFKTLKPDLQKGLIAIFTRPEHGDIRYFLNYKYATPQQKQRLNQLRKVIHDFQKK